MNATSLTSGVANVFRQAASLFRQSEPTPIQTEPQAESAPIGYMSRFDISDHGFALPDVVDFPEFQGISAFPAGTDAEQRLYKQFSQAFDQCDTQLLAQSISQLRAEIENRFDFTEEEDQIKAVQFKNLTSIANWYLRYKTQWSSMDRSDIPANSTFDVLKNDGVFGCTIDTRKLQQLLDQDVSNLLAHKLEGICTPGQGYDRFKMLINNGEHDQLFAALREQMTDQGVLSAAAKYMNSGDLDFKHACLHVCTPEDTHFTQTLQDCKTTSKLIGLHIDPKPVLKIIVYLNDVTKESGPFAYVPQSHRWYFDETEMIFAKGNSTGNYLHSPVHREVASRFPPSFRKNSIIGRFVLDGTSESERLLAAEKLFTTADGGNCIVFDPGNGLHRGGMCASQNRINLQIVLTEK